MWLNSERALLGGGLCLGRGIDHEGHPLQGGLVSLRLAQTELPIDRCRPVNPTTKSNRRISLAPRQPTAVLSMSRQPTAVLSMLTLLAVPVE